MEFENVPILLIGLGGIGSKIVNDVFGRLKEAGTPGFVEALVFDTDQGSLNELEHMEKDCKIQTSTDKTVSFVLERDKNAETWFPVHPRILDMSLINGAGQIRAVSRLALRAAMKEGKLSKIQTVKDRLYRLGGNASEKGVRIMIVSSLMGGTGSGIFLQIPLYLRELMESKFGANRIEIQGTFLLPDVLKGSIDGEGEKKNIYANAYACLREFNAIIQSLVGREDIVELEYRPDQVETMQDISVKSWPYDYCYIYDKEDAKGRVLSTVEDYKRMIAENLFSQIYGPVSDRLYGHFINEIRNIIRENCENIFGGVSVGKLIYPYDDLCDYVTNKVVEENLKDKLLRIDEEYDRQMKQFEENKQNGIDTEKPDRMNIYIDQFEQLSSDKNNLFFKLVAKQLRNSGEEGEETENLIDNYFDGIKEKIDNEIASFIEKNKIEPPKRNSIENAVEGQLKTIILNTEENFKDIKRIINARMESNGESKANIDFGYFDEHNNSFFDSFVKRDNVFVNPVGTRYILYSIKKTLLENIQGVKEDIENKDIELTKKESKKCGDLFKNKTNLVEIIDHAIAADRNPVDKVTFKSLKKFKDEYIDEATKHHKALCDYARFKFELSYYRRMYELVNSLIEEYELMFTKLATEKASIERRIFELANKHSSSNNTSTNIYVLGDASFKEKIWESIPANTKNEALSNVLPEKMYEYLKKNSKLKLENKKTDVLGYEDIFNNLILKGCKETIKKDVVVKELLDMNITKALAIEYNFSKELGKIETTKDVNVYMKEKLKSLYDLTQPFCPNVPGVSEYKIWGINDNIRLAEEVGDGKMLITKAIEDVSDKSTNIVENKILSKYEVMYLNSLFGLKINDFTKLNDDDSKGQELGEYYKKYDELIKGISDDNRNIARNIEITPHLDKSWHLILPYIGRGGVELKDKAKAFLVSIPMDYVVVEKKEIADGKFKLDYKRKIGQAMPIVIKNVDGSVVQGNIYKYYEGMMHNPKICFAINEEFNKHLKEVQDDSVINDKNAVLSDRFIKNICYFKYPGYEDIGNVLDVIIKIFTETRNVSDIEKEKMLSSLQLALAEIVENVVSAYEKDEDIKNQNALSIFKKMIETSKLAGTVKKDTTEYNSTIGKIKDKIKEYEAK